MKFKSILKKLLVSIYSCLSSAVYFGRHPSLVPHGSIIFFPCSFGSLCCGLAGILAFKSGKAVKKKLDIDVLHELVSRIRSTGFDACYQKGLGIQENYLGGDNQLASFLKTVRKLKTKGFFNEIFCDSDVQKSLATVTQGLATVIEKEKRRFTEEMGRLDAGDLHIVSSRIERLMDIRWCISSEILANLNKIRGLIPQIPGPCSPETIWVFKEINAVLNSIDRLEVRGRDSAGLSLMLMLSQDEFNLIPVGKLQLLNLLAFYRFFRGKIDSPVKLFQLPFIFSVPF